MAFFFPLNFPLNNDFLHHFAKEVGVQYTSWQIPSRMTFLNHSEQHTDIWCKPALSQILCCTQNIWISVRPGSSEICWPPSSTGNRTRKKLTTRKASEHLHTIGRDILPWYRGLKPVEVHCRGDNLIAMFLLFSRLRGVHCNYFTYQVLTFSWLCFQKSWVIDFKGPLSLGNCVYTTRNPVWMDSKDYKRQWCSCDFSVNCISIWNLVSFHFT